MKKILLLLVILSVAVSAAAQNKKGSLSKMHELPEVTVRVKPIEQSPDTIKYNVAAFQGKDDHYLEDVLKKMPGIEVAQNGQILYKGETINQLNIEGQNLLGNRYSQATRNLPVEAISQVQVMENDQPIRALKSTAPSDKATLNIKLKNGYKTRPFGEVQGGIGGFDNALWNNRLSLIQISKKNQMLLTAKMNNAGEALSDNATNSIDVSDIGSYVSLPQNAINAMERVFSPVEPKRYLKNNSHAVDFNHLHRIGRYGSLRTNIHYFDTGDNLSDSISFLYGGAYSASLTQGNHIHLREHTLAPKLHYELNAPAMYVVDDLSGSISYMSTGNSLYSNGSLLSQDVKRHPGYVRNKLNLMFTTGGHSYYVNSTLLYFRRTENMLVGDKENVYNAAERIGYSRLRNDNDISASFPLLGNMLHLNYAIAYQRDNMDIDRGERNANSYLLNTLTPSYSIRYSHGYVALDLPLNYYAARVPWRQSGSNIDRFYVSPSLRWNHKFSPLWQLSLSGALQQSVEDNMLTPFTFLSDYRTRHTTPDQLGWARSTNTSFKVNYCNFTDMFTWQLLATMSWRRRDWRYAYSYTDSYTMMTPLWQASTSRDLLVQTNADKTFTKAHVQIKGGLTYSRNEMPVAQNDLQRMVKTNIVTATMLFRWYHISWLQLTDEATFNVSWQDRYEDNGHNALKDLHNDLRLSIYPVSGLSLTMTCDYSMMETQKSEYKHLVFADATLRYVPAKRWDLSLTLNNIFNRKQYIEASYTGFNYRYFSLPLRGREALLAVKYKF